MDQSSTSEIISIGTVFLWMILYIVMIGFTTMAVEDIVVTYLAPDTAEIINLLAEGAFGFLYLSWIVRRYRIQLKLFHNVTFLNVLMVFVIAVILHLLLDRFIDVYIDRAFDESAKQYYESVAELMKYPFLMFLRVCILAPIVEETLIRGCILKSLNDRYHTMIAVIVSVFIFAILHFNFVQTISAVVLGICLSVCYLRTGSLLLCILLHFFYNLLAYLSLMYWN